MTVFDRQGKEAIGLGSTGGYNNMTVYDYDKARIPAVQLESREGENSVTVTNERSLSPAVILGSQEAGNSVVVIDKQSDELAVVLSSGDKRNEVSIIDKQTGKRTKLED